MFDLSSLTDRDVLYFLGGNHVIIPPRTGIPLDIVTAHLHDYWLRVVDFLFGAYRSNFMSDYCFNSFKTKMTRSVMKRPSAKGKPKVNNYEHALVGLTFILLAQNPTEKLATRPTVTRAGSSPPSLSVPVSTSYNHPESVSNWPRPLPLACPLRSPYRTSFGDSYSKRKRVALSGLGKIKIPTEIFFWHNKFEASPDQLIWRKYCPWPLDRRSVLHKTRWQVFFKHKARKCITIPSTNFVRI